MSLPGDVQPPTPERGPSPAAATAVDACGLSCGALEPLIAKHLRALAPGEVLEVRSDRKEAGDGIRAWLWLTGHTLVTIEREEGSPQTRYFVRKKTLQT